MKKGFGQPGTLFLFIPKHDNKPVMADVTHKDTFMKIFVVIKVKDRFEINFDLNIFTDVNLYVHTKNFADNMIFKSFRRSFTIAVAFVK